MQVNRLMYLLYSLMLAVALVLLSLLRRELATHGIHCSIRRMISLLTGIKEIVMAFPPAKRAREPILRTTLCSISDEQRRIYEALDLVQYPGNSLSNVLQSRHGKRTSSASCRSHR